MNLSQLIPLKQAMFSFHAEYIAIGNKMHTMTKCCEIPKMFVHYLSVNYKHYHPPPTPLVTLRDLI